MPEANPVFFYLDTGAKNSIISGLTFINGKRVIASAIYIDAKKVTLEKCTFRNNHGTDNGGSAVATTYNLNDASGFVVCDCIFKGNSSPASSGALAAFSKNFKIINTVFENNYVSNNMGRTAVGGALIAGRNQQGTYGTIFGCTFKNNYVKSDNNEYSRGGSAGIQDQTIVENCKFISNNADAGGAIYCYGSATIKNTNFTSNTAKYHGGAIYTINPGKITITIPNSITIPQNILQVQYIHKKQN